jgi:hypothetical protein
MISMPSIPTNRAHYQKTSTKLRWTSALEEGYCHGVDQMPAALILMHAYPSAYAYLFAYVCLCCYLLMHICVTGRQGVESESRELAVGQGREPGWAGLARLDKDRRLG